MRSSRSSPPGWSLIDDELAARTGLGSGEEWLAVRGFRRIDGAEFPVCRTEYYINRAFAAVGRLLPRHTGPIFPLIEDIFGLSIVEVRQEIAAVLISSTLAEQLSVEVGSPGSRGASHLRDLGRRGRPVDDQHASGVPFPSLDDDATRPRLISHAAMSNTKLIGGRTVRWDDERTAEAYARGWWVREHPG